MVWRALARFVFVLVATFIKLCILQIGLMLMAMLNSTLILVAILKFDPDNTEKKTFQDFWVKRYVPGCMMHDAFSHF